MIAEGALIARRQIFKLKVLFLAFNHASHFTFESAKTKLQSRRLNLAERIALRVSCLCESVELSAPRKSQSQKFGPFVEGFSHRIVNGTAHFFEVIKVSHHIETRMPARNHRG